MKTRGKEIDNFYGNLKEEFITTTYEKESETSILVLDNHPAPLKEIYSSIILIHLHFSSKHRKIFSATHVNNPGLVCL